MIILSVLCLIWAIIVLYQFFKCMRLLRIVYPNLWERDADAKKAMQVSLVLFMPVISVISAGFAIYFFCLR